jgi:hypothetical protein
MSDDRSSESVTVRSQFTDNATTQAVVAERFASPREPPELPAKSRLLVIQTGEGLRVTISPFGWFNFLALFLFVHGGFFILWSVLAVLIIAASFLQPGRVLVGNFQEMLIAFGIVGGPFLLGFLEVRGILHACTRQATWTVRGDTLSLWMSSSVREENRQWRRSELTRVTTEDDEGRTLLLVETVTGEHFRFPTDSWVFTTWLRQIEAKWLAAALWQALERPACPIAGLPSGPTCGSITRGTTNVRP